MFCFRSNQLDIMEPKATEDIYKYHFGQQLPFCVSWWSSSLHSAGHNRAYAFGTVPVNAAFSQENHLMEDGNIWFTETRNMVTCSNAFC